MTPGQWMLCIQDSASGAEDYVGPFRSPDRADAAAERLRRHIAAIPAADEVTVVVEWIKPVSELAEIRDELTRDYGKDNTR